MTPPSPHMRELARRLAAHEASVKKNGLRKKPKARASFKDPIADSAADFAADCAAIEKLRPQLVTLMSSIGYQALLQRARAIVVAEETNPGQILLLAGVLTLLEAFIGEILTLQLVTELWPTVPLDHLDSGKGESIEKEI